MLTKIETSLVLVGVVLVTLLAGLQFSACSAAQQQAEQSTLDRLAALCDAQLFDGAVEGYVCAAVDLIDGAVKEVTGSAKPVGELSTAERASVAKLLKARGARTLNPSTVAAKGAQ
jgi:hypothetical protein